VKDQCKQKIAYFKDFFNIFSPYLPTQKTAFPPQKGVERTPRALFREHTAPALMPS
jgi:hypothetical protein